MCAAATPPSGRFGQSASLAQVPFSWRQVPQPRNSPGARQTRNPLLPQSVFDLHGEPDVGAPPAPPVPRPPVPLPAPPAPATFAPPRPPPPPAPAPALP